MSANNKYNKISKIVKQYRTYLANNYSVFYKNRDYFYTLLSFSSNYSKDIKYINRENFKKKLIFKSENDIRCIVDKYFFETYNIDTKKISYLNIPSDSNENSQCFFIGGKKQIKLQINNNIQDSLIMAHEFRHYLNMDISKQNPILDCLTESLSIFEEINISNYIKKNQMVKNFEIIEVMKMIYVKTFNMIDEILVFLRIDQIIDYNGNINKNKFKDTYLNEANLNNDIDIVLDIYNNGGFKFHFKIWYVVGMLIASSINKNLKCKKIDFQTIQMLSERLSLAENFDILNLVQINLNDLDLLLNNYKKELEDIF